MKNKLKTTITKYVSGDSENKKSLGGKGIVTGYGSPEWEYGLDFVLNNPVLKSIANGVVVSVVPAAKSGGFGNRIKVKYDDGYEAIYSHLATLPKLKLGTRISPNSVLGKMGNTGNVQTFDSTINEYREPTTSERAKKAGTHLDITMYGPDGQVMSPQETAQYHGITNE